MWRNEASEAGVQRWMIHSLCMQHKLSSAITGTLGPVRTVGVLFCGTTLLHRGMVLSSILHKLEAYVDKFLELTTVPPTPAELDYNRALLDLLRWDTGWVDPNAREKRTGHEARMNSAIPQLLGRLAGLYSGGRLIHYCHYGCCPSGDARRPAAVRKVVDALIDILFGYLPPIPALNRWTHLYPCISWWCVACNLVGLMVELWTGRKLDNTRCAPDEDALDDEGDAPGLAAHAVEMLIGPGEDETVRDILRARHGKTTRWITHPEARESLIIITLVVRCALHTLGHLFKTGAQESGRSILELLHGDAATVRAVDRLLSLLESLDDGFWLVARGADGWTTRTLQKASNCFLRLATQIYARMIWPLLQWPWPLASIVPESLQHGDAPLVIDRLSSACPNCVDQAFTSNVKAAGGERLQELLLDPESKLHTAVADTFRRINPTNILSEDRFSRSLRCNLFQHDITFASRVLMSVPILKREAIF